MGVRGREGRRSRRSPVTPRARHTANETPTPLLVRVARGKRQLTMLTKRGLLATTATGFHCFSVTTAGKRTTKQKQAHCKFFRANPLVFSSVFFLICVPILAILQDHNPL